MNTTSNQEIWEVESGGQIFETNFGEMTAWISEGSLLRIDRVRKENLRWIEAGKVPALIDFFNAKEAGEPLPPVITTNHCETLGVPTPPAQPAVNGSVNHTLTLPSDACSMHPDAPAAFICETCSNLFCRACPNSYGGTVKICPFCGAMCSLLGKVDKKVDVEEKIQALIGEGFGFGDFGRALAFPFKFKVSLFFGAVLYMIFSLGQAIVGFGGIYMMFSAIFCFLLANMLTFGVLANTIENFTQGKMEQNFMPSFDDFSLWDDVIHPFFLNIGVYISSFGPFIAVMLVGIFMFMGAVTKEMNPLQADAARTVNPELPYAASAVKQSEKVRELLNKTNEDQQKRIAAIENGEIPETTAPVGQPIDPEQMDFERVNKMIAEQKKAQLESVIGKTPETVSQEKTAFLSQLLGYGAIFLILGGITLIWGFFYFPAALSVAGYTRSFGAAINPTVGLDTIKRLGSSYALILLMGFILLVASGAVSGVLSVVFAPFDMPALGNIPARAIGSLFGFYFSVVFSCVIAYALLKAADKLKLYR